MRNWTEIPKGLPKYELPGRVFIYVEGWCQHTGMDTKWGRRYYGIASTEYYTPYGIDKESMERILHEADIPRIDCINNIYWAPLKFPKLDF